MKGILTLSIEVDYATMLEPSNQGAIYLFTGATKVEDMVKAHMDKLGEELTDVLKDKPLLTYTLDGRLRNEEVQEVSEMPVQEVAELTEDTEQEDLIGKLDVAIEYVSMELGIPHKIKVNNALLEQLESLSRDDVKKEGMVAMYQGFKIEPEAMEEPFMIVYKTYSGSEIKFYSPM